MPVQTTDQPVTAVLDSVRGVRDALSVQRVFGDPYDMDGVTVLPVARVAGGGGGGGDVSDDADASGGFGTGFGLGARALGVFEVHDGELAWKPAVDVDRVIRGGQVLAGIIAVCLTLVVLRRS